MFHFHDVNDVIYLMLSFHMTLAYFTFHMTLAYFNSCICNFFFLFKIFFVPIFFVIFLFFLFVC